MGTKEQDVQERILRATIVCIERDGLDATGIREIAREAQVNSAAISYYFRSKDKLIAQALEQTLEQAFGNVLVDFDRLRAEGLGIREAFEVLLEDVVGNTARYPRIAHAHLHDALVHQRYDGAAIQRLNAFLGDLALRLAPVTPHLSEDKLRLALTQIWSSLFLLSMMPRLFDQFILIDFDTLETRRTWVKQSCRLLFVS
ncbi:TetR/AcrR family transcriptional regulator [Stigmatella aurantiaca]|uniref:Transcriptional regulator, TetR family n=2 Tax=Stigmatella aurantiaca (strain DW4/3-1) TaxID=378806 RepID=E3FR28_STIAD|nr:TetR/AcrR family transcriptional regulator [Stigmatella aurantiaca]ADO73247.1 Transcriptional regulator, TetR family [Stigmatella aurantiaca DW4/3-1]